jgi:hypothetical protein
MQRLSSRTTSYAKWVFPLLVLGYVLFVAASHISSHGEQSIESLITPALVVALSLVIFKFVILAAVDEVWDAGDALVVCNKSREERIPLAAIADVGYSSYFNPPRVTLTLRSPGVFGGSIVFLAPARFLAFSRSPLIDDLIKRIDATRQHAR